MVPILLEHVRGMDDYLSSIIVPKEYHHLAVLSTKHIWNPSFDLLDFLPFLKVVLDANAIHVVVLPRNMDYLDFHKIPDIAVEMAHHPFYIEAEIEYVGFLDEWIT